MTGLAVLAIGATSCGGGRAIVQVAPELASSAGAAGRTLELSGSSIDDLARSAGASPAAVEEAARGGQRPVVAGWTTSVRDANARTQEPVRDAVVDAACDALTEGTAVDQTLAEQLEENGLDGLTQQKKYALFVDAYSLGQQLYGAAQSPDPEVRSAVAVFCFAAKASG